jgi:hypothetical protein
MGNRITLVNRPTLSCELLDWCFCHFGVFILLILNLLGAARREINTLDT